MKERHEAEYKSKEARLKTTFKYKGKHTGLPHTLTNKIQHIRSDAQYILQKKLHLRKIISKLLLILRIETEQLREMNNFLATYGNGINRTSCVAVVSRSKNTPPRM